MIERVFEYRITWINEDGGVQGSENFIAQVDNPFLEDYEIEEAAREMAEEFATDEEPELEHDIILIDAR